MKAGNTILSNRAGWLKGNLLKIIILLHTITLLFIAPYLLHIELNKAYVFGLFAVLNIPLLLWLYIRRLPNGFELLKALHYRIQPDIVSLAKGELTKDIQYENSLRIPFVITFVIVLAEYGTVVMLFDGLLKGMF
ncbi:MAG: hypothetical protein HY965_00325 [Ignavibacteriales bacterium]|nr:hypothetical protein [Ignavibacteriales bacterium]